MRSIAEILVSLRVGVSSFLRKQACFLTASGRTYCRGFRFQGASFYFIGPWSPISKWCFFNLQGQKTKKTAPCGGIKLPKRALYVSAVSATAATVETFGETQEARPLLFELAFFRHLVTLQPSQLQEARRRECGGASGGIMARSNQASRSVFVGNIPYSATEEQLEDVFRTVGHVVSFRCPPLSPCPCVSLLTRSSFPHTAVLPLCRCDGAQH